MIQKEIDKIVKKYKLTKECEADIKKLTLKCLIEGAKYKCKKL